MEERSERGGRRVGRKEEKKEKWGGREERNEGEAGGGKKGKEGWRKGVRREGGEQRKMVMQCPVRSPTYF